MHRVVFVGPESQGNVGALARVMANFGLKELVLVEPCELGDEARARAMHAWPLVEKARKMRYQDAIKGFDSVIGTTAKVFSDHDTTRAYLTPRELAGQLKKTRGSYCFVFGRESRGLTTAELRKCDVVVHIDCSPDYPVLNISHAAAILFYELFSEKENKVRQSSARQKRDAIKLFEELACSLELRDPENAVKQFNSVISRAFVSGSEARGIAGVMSRASKKLRRGSIDS
jgi:TrmH family RNA methyltransferase